jgi:hypothetical protein
MTQEFNAPVEEIFNYLSDHNNFGALLKANIKRIKDSPSDNVNGLDSVRSIGIGPLTILEETIITFEKPHLIEYQISNNVPINYHKGRLEFTSIDKNKCSLYYTIDMESKFSFADGLIINLIKSTIVNGLKNLAKRYQ